MHGTLTSLSLAVLLLAAGVAIATPAAKGEDATQKLLTSAEALALQGDFDRALPLYERAIGTLADKPQQQHALRYRYGMVLNALAARARPELYPLARAQFESVLAYLDGGATLGLPAPFEHSPARVRSALAHTYHQQSASEQDPLRRAHLLRTAYQLYSRAISGLTRHGEWHNLAITYFNLGQVCEWQGNLEEAIEWVEKAVELDARHGFADLEEDRAYLLGLRQQLNPPQPADATST
ncbi:tetratricopeptide repeat protein [Microbulbifer thermotolerans]|uniref:tetratricopeptide repeat protein n=1 Tax=Microbulbifer thermotolerans TaxID=252514 RepID=UPI0022489EC9|nr:tetratricopeptide repeat protein [Microbulbifer thermotolerans]MCX2779498.1 tetratricopeptide repeat protein [Microbulbifer thermotolerans]MCX2793369.1 tetratricopeptide repeat protein [Microbulbifer thermotolerans]MCX2806057.1 tetratricopeptide repeat protein [Microbulbifer thermotolerans]MCX2830600.1 tetratricopeptide repeat protein [Microbulbifer thermotolerans]